MKNILVYLLIVLGTMAKVSAQGHTYYVSNEGDDQNNGLAPNTSLRTIAKVNSLDLQPGDKVLFKRGSMFRGQLNLLKSGTADAHIALDAYGAGKSPILTGSTSVTGWVKKAGNIWQASCPQCGVEVTGLYINSESLPLGRYPKLSAPNKGYLTIQSHNDYTQLTGEESVPGNWVGGEIVYRPLEWVIDKRTITAQSGNTFDLEADAKNPSKYNMQDTWGYFIQNHPATLTENGEWCYNKADKTLLLYDADGNPNDKPLEVTTFSKALHLEGVSYVDVMNIHFQKALEYNLFINNSSDINIQDDTISDAGQDGISISGGHGNIVIQHNHIANINNNGVAIRQSPHLAFRGNTLENIATIAGRGKSGDQQYFAFQYSDDNGGTVIENNSFHKLGYIGIAFYGSNIMVRHNLIVDCNLVKGDGAGIYTFRGPNGKDRVNQTVQENIIVNSRGAREGSHMKLPYSNAAGIYLDICSENISITGNTIANAAGPGIYLNGDSNADVTGNTCFNSGFQFSIFTTHYCGSSGNNIHNNLFVSRLPGQFAGRYENGDNSQDNPSSFGTIDNNAYVNLANGNGTFLVNVSNDRHTMAFKDWKSDVGKDNSSSNLRSSTGSNDVIFEYNFSDKDKVISLNGTYTDVKNNIYAGQATIAPFSSIILVKKT